MSTTTTTRDPITTEPTHTGAARAWRVDLVQLRANIAQDPRVQQAQADDATVCAYVIEAPWAHPFWHSYYLFCVHLRDLPGQSQPPIKKFAEVTHEVALYALNPDRPRQALVDGRDMRPGRSFLHPVNYVGQFVAEDDAMAAGVVDRAVIDICNGLLSPDTDFRSQWVARFGGHYYGQQG